MLFHAVFCAFLAEYKLEHTIKHQQEIQYMLSMVEVLVSDSAMFAGNFRQRKNRIDMIDSLVYFFGRSIPPPFNIFLNDRTIQQLKNSGGPAPDQKDLSFKMKYS
jgi:hypothetical protein